MTYHHVISCPLLDTALTTRSTLDPQVEAELGYQFSYLNKQRSVKLTWPPLRYLARMASTELRIKARARLWRQINSRRMPHHLLSIPPSKSHPPRSRPTFAAVLSSSSPFGPSCCVSACQYGG